MEIFFLAGEDPSTHRENTRREESKYLECENRQLALIAIATYIFKPPTKSLRLGGDFSIYIFRF